MGGLIQREFCALCAACCIDLLFEDLARLPWLASLVADAKRIVTFTRKNHHMLAIFHSLNAHDIVLPTDTPFAYSYLVFHRLYMVMDSLCTSVVDRHWLTMSMANTDIARHLQYEVLDEAFWTKIETILPILKYIYTVLHILDKEGSTLGLVYHIYTRT
ncbi:hypothetical protein KP509_36G055900 [Ceratopteris richardii]|uniref:Uncharacterized protein n=1 Tax=Ceratopteris richardii TaxID=49495 RepID=A0A8T2QCR2_CERRI|nr:hypothetical protein KP509_36G055900 [Ceratopteris richardii]